MTWNINSETDRVRETRMVDLVGVNKEKRKCQIIDFAVSNYNRSL